MLGDHAPFADKFGFTAKVFFFKHSIAFRKSGKNLNDITLLTCNYEAMHYLLSFDKKDIALGVAEFQSLINCLSKPSETSFS